MDIVDEPVLGMLNPTGAGDPIPLTKPHLVIGRRPSCDIPLRFENVSGKHCELKWDEGRWRVIDLNSTNKTRVNGRVVQQVTLNPGDVLAIASHEFRIDYTATGPGRPESSDVIPAAGIGGKSLMELAGLEAPRAPRRSGSSSAPEQSETPSRKPVYPRRPEAAEASASAQPPEPPRTAPAAEPPAGPAKIDDDEFLRMIEEETAQGGG